MTYQETKTYLKKLAIEIRELKKSRKQDNRNGRSLFSIEGEISELRRWNEKSS